MQCINRYNSSVVFHLQYSYLWWSISHFFHLIFIFHQFGIKSGYLLIDGLGSRINLGLKEMGETAVNTWCENIHYNQSCCEMSRHDVHDANHKQCLGVWHCESVMCTNMWDRFGNTPFTHPVTLEQVFNTVYTLLTMKWHPCLIKILHDAQIQAHNT